jgi:hypothetical protein
VISNAQNLESAEAIKLLTPLEIHSRWILGTNQQLAK